jgi:hypothetical protein
VLARNAGEVSEWLKEQHWKCCRRLKPSPPSSEENAGKFRRFSLDRGFLWFLKVVGNRVQYSPKEIDKVIRIVTQLRSEGRVK